MENKIIKRSEMAVEILEASFTVGTYLYYRGNSRRELHLITEQLEPGWFNIQQVDAVSLEIEVGPQKVSLNTLQAYYKPVCVEMKHTRDLALRLLDGEAFEDLGEPNEDTTSLMHLGSKDTLMHLRRETDQARVVAETVRKHAEMIADQMRDKMMEKVNRMNGIIRTMEKQISRLDYVIQTIETYAGIKENIITLQRGIPADETCPVVIRQAVIYMDEEMALIDPDFDWQKIESFDRWLLENDRYKTLLPDIKSIVAIKPRRRDKVYSYGTSREDAFHNWVMNQNNHITLFLIRNGENLYRLDSEHISLEDRLFPNADEYVSILDKEQEWAEKYHRNDDDMSTAFRKRFTKVSFLLQGLLERSEVFSPHHFTGSLIKMEGLDGHIQMMYELDLSRQLTDGRPAFKEWVRGLNEKLGEGSRIMLVNKNYKNAGYDFSRKDYVTYYSNDWNTPGYPEDGVYTLHNSNPKGYDKYYEAHHPFIIKFFGTNDRWTWEHGSQQRKNRTSIHIDPSEAGIINYDELKIEDVDYYLHSRLHRSQYFEFVVMLQKVKALMLEEQAEEEHFIQMMQGQMMSRGLAVKDGYTPEKVIRKSLDTIKNRLKWKRPVSSKEKETYTLVERNLFSKKNRDKYFK